MCDMNVSRSTSSTVFQIARCGSLPPRKRASFTRGDVCKAQQSGGDGQPDLIETLVRNIFGTRALEDESPFGMKRLTPDDCPEIWPAVTDEWAERLPTDTSEIATLRPLLARTQLETSPLRLAYCAEQHGWSADEFHARVNTFGAGLLVLETVGGAVCGGYNPRGWIGLGEDRDSIAAFLFTWPDGDTSKRPIKLPKVGGASLAVMDKPENGIQFGPDGLKLLAPGREKIAKSRLGSYYARMPDGGRSLFASGEEGKAGAAVKRLRCYVAEGAGETWELDGIIWKTDRQQSDR